MVEVMDRTRLNYTSMVTNTFFLDKLPIRYIKRMDMISMSNDGSKDTTLTGGRESTTWSTAGPGGLRRKWVSQASPPRDDSGSIQISRRRSSISRAPVSSILCIGSWMCSPVFTDKTDEYEAWFEQVYNPGISRLVEWWADEILKSGKVHRLVPFHRCHV